MATYSAPQIARIKQQLLRRQWRHKYFFMDAWGGEFQSQEGSVVWREYWKYPSADLLKYQDGLFPYSIKHGLVLPATTIKGNEGTRPAGEAWVYYVPLPHPTKGGLVLPYRNPAGDWASAGNRWNWQCTLTVEIAIAGTVLHVVIPVAPLPLNEPRIEAEGLRYRAKHQNLTTPLAQTARQSPRKFDEWFFSELRAPNPETGQRNWYLQVGDATPPEELLTLLVIYAAKQKISVGAEDTDGAHQYIQRLVRSSDLVGEVWNALVKNFDLPTSPYSLPDYIRHTARDIRRRVQRQEEQPSLIQARVRGTGVLPTETREQSWKRSIFFPKGEQRYNVDQAVQILVRESPEDAWVPSRDTLYDWINKGHRWYGKPRTVCVRDSIFVTEDGLARIHVIIREEREHHRLQEKAHTHGVSRSNFKKLLQRNKQPDGTPDWRAIEAHVDRYKRTEKEEPEGSFEEQIAELEAGLYTADSDQREVILDALQQLRQRQHGPEQ
jgi:hypothetical protein